jgi:hypothetical protein
MAKSKKKQAVSPSEEQGRIAAAKGAVVKAAEKVVEVVKQAAEAVQEHVVKPVVKAVKPKKKRFVREKKVKREQGATPALPPPSKKVTAKLMSKKLALPPKEEKTGQKPKA